MDWECPYCGCEALAGLESERFSNPDEVYFQDGSGYGKLTEINWQAYRCDVCERVLILDEDEVRRIEDATKEFSGEKGCQEEASS